MAEKAEYFEQDKRQIILKAEHSHKSTQKTQEKHLKVYKLSKTL